MSLTNGTGPDDSMGRCFTTGPCDTMRANLIAGGVILYANHLHLVNGVRLADCPWCGGELSPATFAAWPMEVLHPPKAAA